MSAVVTTNESVGGGGMRGGVTFFVLRLQGRGQLVARLTVHLLVGLSNVWEKWKRVAQQQTNRKSNIVRPERTCRECDQASTATSCRCGRSLLALMTHWVVTRGFKKWRIGFVCSTL